MEKCSSYHVFAQKIQRQFWLLKNRCNPMILHPKPHSIQFNRSTL